ncbi:DUF6789 family protein [Thiohalophilus thiocyanatoxydans]|uniref:DUF1440 domain-containing protein n=1 Tax=Thiohalophilus thiocyanatoxydans TaxID=381308 RepID=A0A4R8ISA5_9GAMM|nr:DUF6789 family protein [Thiohalophilus thiocyanatoxydans]TDY03921.1 hypothetical protein EDC23_0292 [Thiohalophilus thiocyanatoxydans]
MNHVINGLLAGLVATVVLSVLMVIKDMMGLMPDLNVIGMLAAQMGSGPTMGWLAHIMIGVVGYGLAYSLLFRRLPLGGHGVRGILLGVVGWLVMMLALMPMMGGGLFGSGMPSGMMVPIATLILHVIFGAVLGGVYGRLGHAEV